MQKKSMSEINKEYDLELDKIINSVKKQKAKTVLLQFPDGLKPYADVVVDYLQEKVRDAEFLIWFGSCYGACDLPHVENINAKVDLIVQFGHSAWNYKDKNIGVLGGK